MLTGFLTHTVYRQIDQFFHVYRALLYSIVHIYAERVRTHYNDFEFNKGITAVMQCLYQVLV